MSTKRMIGWNMRQDLSSMYRHQERGLRNSRASEGPDDLAEFRLSRPQRVLRQTLHLLNVVSPKSAVHLATYLFMRPRRKKVTYISRLPEGARRIEVYHGMCKLTAYSWGAGEKTVLLVHGWESHIGRMLPLVTPLVGAGFRVVALDSPGHGQSPGLLTTMYDVGEAIYDALVQLGPVHAVVANSFGAAATMTMLAREADVQPAKLVLVSPMTHFEQHMNIYQRLLGIEGRLEANLRSQLQRRVPMPLERFDVGEAVTRVSSQGLIIHDIHDPVIPAQSVRQVADQWASASLMETSHLGHKKLIANANVQRSIVDFVSGTDSDTLNRATAHVRAIR